MDSPRADNRLPVDESRDHLMIQIARMAYLQDCTQTEIARETGLNRWQVSRLLTEARELGVVRIEIVPRSHRRPDLESDLQRVFGLRDAVIVPGAGQNGDLLNDVAKAAGQYLSAIKPQPSLIGVSWGRTMASVAHWLPEKWADGINVVQINGTVAPVPQSAHHNDVAEIFSRKGNGRFVPLPVPAIVGAKVTREVLEQDRIVADVLQIARSAQVLCFSLGALGKDAALYLSGNILRDELEALEDAGAVGDVLGRFIDQKGKLVDNDLDSRTIGLRFDELKLRDRTIGVAAGTDKHDVVLGALRAGLVNILVTDEATAIFALEHADEC